MSHTRTRDAVNRFRFTNKAVNDAGRRIYPDFVSVDISNTKNIGVIIVASFVSLDIDYMLSSGQAQVRFCARTNIRFFVNWLSVCLANVN